MVIADLQRLSPNYTSKTPMNRTCLLTLDTFLPRNLEIMS